LREAGHDVRCLARFARRLRGRFDEAVEIVEGDVNDGRTLALALSGCDAAYYLIHSMKVSKRFRADDSDAAAVFASAARAAGVKRIIYLGGLGDDRDKLSAHLRSRHEVGHILRLGGVPVIELRAAQVIGSGSVSFEMMRYLTDRLPVMIAPRWALTRCQPIGVRDVLAYLIAALAMPPENRTYEIGGADILTYRDMMLRYARIRGLRRLIITVPFFSPRLSSYWVHLITPIPANMARPLILGLHNEVISRDSSALRDFPSIRPIGFEAAVREALDRSQTPQQQTTWFDAFATSAPQEEFQGLTEGMLVDRRVRESSAGAPAIAQVFSSLGGQRGWLAADALWQIRGAIDRWFGGVGLRRGRRDANDLRVGDAVDFWRVEAFEPRHLLRLRAEMKLPGRAWLQFEAQSKHGGGILVQTAFFEPSGLFGYLYWYGVAPFHNRVFGSMADRIVRLAEAGG
jgi:uncharacterized protein YbjT (DUF2867 family)